MLPSELGILKEGAAMNVNSVCVYNYNNKENKLLAFGGIDKHNSLAM